MKIPYRWVREFVDLALTPAEAADRLVNAGIEVSSVTPLAPPGLAGVVVGEIEAIERDIGESRGGYRLFLCRVSTGRERFAVACGAPNTKVGIRTAFAPPGATLPGGRTIGILTLHGVESQGMLCSERELGIGEEHEAGILALEGDAPLGRDLVGHLGLDDHVLEVEPTPNRPDCLSVLGVARELAALAGGRLRRPPTAPTESGDPARRLVGVRIQAPDLCHRFTARVVRGVTVGPSPAWLQARLRAAGLRPISNVVDVTNYVLWELGHPLHAFDADTVSDATIVVRRAGRGERFTTLDGQERTLDDSMLVIADPRRAIGLAGVMGGAATEVTDRTTRVLLEAAWFDPVTIRRTSRALGLRTDAAYRFERGADIEMLAAASGRAARLIAELAGGAVARGMVDAYPRRHRPKRIRLRMARVSRVLGVAPPAGRARTILAGLGLPTRMRGRNLEVRVPSFRRDLGIEDDLVEEIIRVWGYDKLPATLPARAADVVETPPTLAQAQRVRETLIGAGLSEVITHSFVDPAENRALGAERDAITLLNPLSQEASQLRNHPLTGVLRAVSTNVRRQQPDVRVFEIGKTYAAAGTGTREERVVAMALCGARSDPAWHTTSAPVDVFDAKGLVEHALGALGLGGLAGAGADEPGFEPGAHGVVLAADGTTVAEFGEVSAAVRERFEIRPPVFAAFVWLDVAARLPRAAWRYEPLPRFPSIQRDVAFVSTAEPSFTVDQVEAAIRRRGGPLLRTVALFDFFRLPTGGRSLAWRLTFQAEDRTLTDEEVNRQVAEIVEEVSRRFHISLRSG